MEKQVTDLGQEQTQSDFIDALGTGGASRGRVKSTMGKIMKQDLRRACGSGTPATENQTGASR